MKFINYLLLSIVTISSLIVLPQKFIVYMNLSQSLAIFSLIISIFIVIIYLYKIRKNESKRIVLSFFIILLIFANSFIFFTKTVPFIYHLNHNKYPFTTAAVVLDNKPFYIYFIGGIVKITDNVFPNNIIFVGEQDISYSSKNDILVIPAQNSGIGYSYDIVYLNDKDYEKKKILIYQDSLSINRSKIPTNKFLATHRKFIDYNLVQPWKDDGTHKYEVVDKIMIDYSSHLNISNDYLNSKWEGYFEFEKEQNLKFNIRMDKSIKILINDKLEYESYSGSNEMAILKVNKGKNLIKILHQGGGLKIDISEDDTIDRLKEFLKNKDFDIWYIGVNNVLSKNEKDKTHVDVTLKDSKKPVVLYLKSNDEFIWSFFSEQYDTNPNIIAVIMDSNVSLHKMGTIIENKNVNFFYVKSKFESYSLIPDCKTVNSEFKCNSKGISNINFHIKQLTGHQIKKYLGIENYDGATVILDTDLTAESYLQIYNKYLELDEIRNNSKSDIRLFYEY